MDIKITTNFSFGKLASQIQKITDNFVEKVALNSEKISKANMNIKIAMPIKNEKKSGITNDIANLNEEEIKNIESEYRSKLENQLEDSKKSEKTRITNFMSDEWSDYESIKNLQMKD